MPSTTSPAPDGLILSQITGTFHPGTITLVLGASGAGKSTLLRAVSGVLPPASGSVTVDGASLYRGTRVLRNALMKVGYVGQFAEDGLFRSTVQSELTYSMRPYRLPHEDRQQRVEQGLVQAGIPNAYWNDSPILFSSGQKRRIAIASTLATDASWLLFDEPTAGLDVSSRKAFVQQLMEQRTRRHGIIISTHDLDTLLPVADVVWVLSVGVLMAVKTPDELIQSPDILTDAKLGVPDIIRLNRLIRRSGVPTLISDPEDIALRLLEEADFHRRTDDPTDCTPGDLHLLSDDETHPPLVGTTSSPSAIPLHPTARLCFFGLLAIALFVNDSWPALCANAAMLQVTSLLYGARIWNLVRSVRSVALMIGLSVALAAIRFGGSTSVSIHWSGALPALLGGGTFALAVTMGALLPHSLRRRELQASIEDIFAPLAVFRFPVQALSLAAMLIFRFLPMLSHEVTRFAEISVVRGKRGGRAGRIRFSQLPSMLTPLLLSILRMGEEIATSLEARGLHDFTVVTDRPRNVTWHGNDWTLVSAALLFLAGVLVI